MSKLTYLEIHHENPIFGSKKQKINIEDMDAEVLDNVPEAEEEDETAEDIENAEMSQIDALLKQVAEEKAKVEK